MHLWTAHATNLGGYIYWDTEFISDPVEENSSIGCFSKHFRSDGCKLTGTECLSPLFELGQNLKVTFLND